MDAVFQLPAPFAVIELGRGLAALAEPPQRRVRLAERMGDADPLVLMRVMGCAQREAALGSRYGRVLFDTFTDVVGRLDAEDPRRAEWAEASGVICDTGMLSLFGGDDESADDPRDDKEPPRGSLAADGETLGRRKMLARTATGDVADRLARDTNAEVITTLLLNPRTRELLPVQIAARASTTVEILGVVAESRFQGRLRVMRALAQNPRCPPALSARFLPKLPRTDLVDMAHDRRLPEQTRRSARAILETKPPHRI